MLNRSLVLALFCSQILLVQACSSGSGVHNASDGSINTGGSTGSSGGVMAMGGKTSQAGGNTDAGDAGLSPGNDSGLPNTNTDSGDAALAPGNDGGLPNTNTDAGDAGLAPGDDSGLPNTNTDSGDTALAPGDDSGVKDAPPGGDTDRADTDVGIDRPNTDGAFSRRIVETGTTFPPSTDGTWLMVDYDGDGVPDLVFIKTSNTDTAKAEVHIASAASNFQTRILETGTTFPPSTDGTWLMLDYDGDGVPDLVFIKTSNTDTAKAEVHIASAASDFQTRILETGTTFPPSTDGTWLMVDYDGDHIPDLVFIKTSNTDTAKAEVHIASAASSFQTRILETGTTFPPSTDGTWLMLDYDGDHIPDLVFIKTSNTDTAKAEVHIASARP